MSRVETSKETILKRETNLVVGNSLKMRYRNIMHDQHIFRGPPSVINNEALKMKNSNLNKINIKLKHAENTRTLSQISSVDWKINKLNKLNFQKPKKGAMDKVFQNSDTGPLCLTPRTPTGCKNSETMTEEYIEYLTDNFPTKEAETQTDALLNRIVNRFQSLKNTGIEKSTQIVKSDYLIDFDFEIQGVLRTLMNKIMEQSRMELLEEQEMDQIRNQNKINEHDRLKLLTEIQRKQSKIERINQEKHNRIFQQKLFKQGLVIAHQKLAHTSLAKFLINKMITSTESNLLDVNKYLENKQSKIWTDVLPCYTNESISILTKENMINALVDRLFENHSNMTTEIFLHFTK